MLPPAPFLLHFLMLMMRRPLNEIFEERFKNEHNFLLPAASDVQFFDWMSKLLSLTYELLQ